MPHSQLRAACSNACWIAALTSGASQTTTSFSPNCSLFTQTVYRVGIAARSVRGSPTPPKPARAWRLHRSTGGAFEGQMPFVFNDPLHWLIQASEAREIAAQMTDLGARADMLTIAEEYDRIAQRAAERLDTIQMARLCEQTGVTIKLSTTRPSHDLPRLCGQSSSPACPWEGTRETGRYVTTKTRPPIGRRRLRHGFGFHAVPSPTHPFSLRRDYQIPSGNCGI